MRAVDGVQGGNYQAPIGLSNTTLTGTSSVNTTGLIKTTNLVEGAGVVLGASTTTGLVDGANVACVAVTASVFHLSTALLGGALRVTLTWSFVIPNTLYFVTFDHRTLLLGQPQLTWSGAGVQHRFSGGPNVDGQPSPAGCVDMWTGIAVSATEIYWTVTRALG